MSSYVVKRQMSPLMEWSFCEEITLVSHRIAFLFFFFLTLMDENSQVDMIKWGLAFFGNRGNRKMCGKLSLTFLSSAAQLHFRNSNNKQISSGIFLFIASRKSEQVNVIGNWIIHMFLGQIPLLAQLTFSLNMSGNQQAETLVNSFFLDLYVCTLTFLLG